MTSRFVPATGLGIFLPLYDLSVRLFARQTVIHQHIRQQITSYIDGLQAGAPHPASDSPTPPCILDVGCGTGTLLCELAEELDARYTGIDIDARILQRAQQRPSKGPIAWKCSSATELGIETTSIDVVCSTLLLHHLTHDEKLQALGEMHRAVKPGGRMLLADYGHPASLLKRLQFLPVQFLDGWARTRDNLSGDLPSLIAQAGFADISQTAEFSTLLGTVRCYCATR